MWWAPESTGPRAVASEYWGLSVFVGLYPMPGRVNVAVGLPRKLSQDLQTAPAGVIDALRRTVAEHAPGARDCRNCGRWWRGARSCGP